ncbi:oxidative damage protection protein [Sphaerobacter sp.]|uniref:oxidative damage protection protein n=1 Tax=Sphaerobacter sp. TaxID=2099654 RepID=UPI001D7057AB|nr:oxidative damage protection protein [Sphaerobacter sp.]MBX5445608.1 oxidative damage protection protein [Sphaerobacter sp.]
MARLVKCAKLGRELPGLEKPPFPGPLGERIYNEISADAWELWKQQQTIIINHYGLNPADPDDRQVLRDLMEEFFFGEGAQMPEGWTPVGAGGAPAKGGGAPRRKK